MTMFPRKNLTDKQALQQLARDVDHMLEDLHRLKANYRARLEMDLFMDHPDGPRIVTPVDFPEIVEALLPDGWTVGDGWWASDPSQRLEDGRWILYLTPVKPRQQSG